MYFIYPAFAYLFRHLTILLNALISLLQDVTLVKDGGSLGFSIIGGTDHSCIPFGGKEPGIFVSHVSFYNGMVYGLG